LDRVIGKGLVGLVSVGRAGIVKVSVNGPMSAPPVAVKVSEPLKLAHLTTPHDDRLLTQTHRVRNGIIWLPKWVMES
jgi:hypothetical protein